MRITELTLHNYRTIADLTIPLSGFYTALCGKNDSGKTNVLNSIKTVFEDSDTGPFEDESALSAKTDIPRWMNNAKDKAISIAISCLVDPTSDAGLFLFLKDYLKIQEPDAGQLVVKLTNSCSPESPVGSISVEVAGLHLERIQAQEVVNKLKTSRAVLFHDSTELPSPFQRNGSLHLLRDLSKSERDQLQVAKKKLNGAVGRIAKQQQKEIADLIGRLKEKYKVGVSAPEFDPTYVPLTITLGEDSVELEQWGSGTRNRTRILLTLFKARRVSEQQTSASKVTPVIIIEEPESFLHPSAQAEFGRMLQDLADEFKIQVIVATHSPYMLSMKSPGSNLLLKRRVEKKRLRESELADTAGEHWMEPFGLALGIANEAFGPWHDALFKNSNVVIFVEGETDREYFELLRQTELGPNRLRIAGDIVPYGGKDNIKNVFLLRFMKQQHRTCFVTYDLDAEKDVLPALETAGFTKGVDCLPLGGDQVRSIEGLLPEQCTKAVQTANTDLMNTIAFGTAEQKKSAKSRYKLLLLQEFKKSAQPTEAFYGGFYPIIRCINKGLTDGSAALCQS
jgi:energy-coupling factor transporter ATP-binding protein EcfA2